MTVPVFGFSIVAGTGFRLFVRCLLAPTDSGAEPHLSRLPFSEMPNTGTVGALAIFRNTEHRHRWRKYRTPAPLASKWACRTGTECLRRSGTDAGEAFPARSAKKTAGLGGGERTGSLRCRPTAPLRTGSIGATANCRPSWLTEGPRRGGVQWRDEYRQTY